jgi:arabinofuranosyltransferase
MSKQAAAKAKGGGDPGGQATGSSGGFERFQFLLIAIAFGAILVRTAWVCDDAYITLRTVDNFLHGYGLRWNIDERVQTYTHPLWMLLMIPMHFATGEPYFSTLLLCAAATLATLWLICRRLAVTPAAMLLAATLLFFSKAFIDYSTSGLENPLSHLSMAGFLLLNLDRPPSVRRAGWLSTIAALATLTRPDHLILYLPVLAIQPFITGRFRATLGALALGTLPLAAWGVFSVIYYGFPLPNPAYAKVLVGEGMTHELLVQGFMYYLHSLDLDPVTLLTIATGIWAAFAFRMKGLRLPALGVLLYLVYVWQIGGDFMSGRFFTTPLLLAVLILARLPWSWREKWPVWLPLGFLVLIGSNAPYRPFATGSDYRFHEPAVDSVVDERSYYFQDAGLINMSRRKYLPNDWNATFGRDVRRQVKERTVVLWGTVGYQPYYAGPVLHVIDILGLTDPLVARMPSHSASFYRPGHIHRPVPRDYFASVKARENLIRDKKLAEVYDALRTITDGPIWTVERWKAIYAMNIGRYRRWLRDYEHVYALSEIQTRVEDGTYWDNAENIVMGLEGIRIDMEGVRHHSELDVGVDSNEKYALAFYLDGEKTWETEAPKGNVGIHNRHVAVDPECAERGYDEIRVRPIEEYLDKRYALGHLILSESAGQGEAETTP